MSSLSSFQVKLDMFGRKGPGIVTAEMERLADNIMNLASKLTYYKTGKLANSGKILTSGREGRITIRFRAIRNSQKWPNFNYAIFLEEQMPMSRHPDPQRGPRALVRAYQHYRRSAMRALATKLTTFMDRKVRL